MKIFPVNAILKSAPGEVGVVLNVYKLGEQKRLTVQFKYSKVDADIQEFDLVGEEKDVKGI